MAIADKDAHPGFLVGDVAEVGCGAGRGVLGRAVERGGDLGGSAGSLGDGVGDVLGLAEGTGEKDARAWGAGGVVGVGAGKAIVVERDAEVAGQVLHALWRGKAGGQDEEVKALLAEAGILGDKGDEEVAGLLELAEEEGIARR